MLILLVEDDGPLAASIASAFEAQGWRVDISARGEPVPMSLQRDAYDALVLDIGLPGIDGLETLKRIKAINPDAEIIMLTGHGSVASGVEAMKLGAGDFLQKPVELADLLSKIGEARDKRMLVLQKRSQEELRKILQAKSW